MHEHFSMYRETWREVGYVFLHCIKLTCLAEMFPKSIAELGPARLTEPKFDFGHFAVNPVMATEMGQIYPDCAVGTTMRVASLNSKL